MLEKIATINALTGAIEYSEHEVDDLVPDPSIRIAEIDARLTALDLASVRALRATVAGTATEDDVAQLTALDTEAAALRAERAGLTAVAGTATEADRDQLAALNGDTDV